MKLAAILFRGARKDYVDVYFVLQQTSLIGLFEVASKKYPYNAAFPAVAVQALACFDDAEAEPMLRMIKPVK